MKPSTIAQVDQISARAVLAAALVLSAFFPVVAADRVPAKGGDITITALIHASVQLEHGRTVVQIDPWSAGDLSAAKRADLVLVTDTVGHHFDVAAINQLRKPGAPVIIPAGAKGSFAEGTVIGNGEALDVAGMHIEATPAYDLTPGEPYHPKGKANGYLITLAGKRILVAGVTECVPELRTLRNIDVAFIPVNLPAGRMAAGAAAECVKAIQPKVVYPYHYDQAYAARVTNGRETPSSMKDSEAAAAAVRSFADALRDQPVDVRLAAFYPAHSPGTNRPQQPR